MKKVITFILAFILLTLIAGCDKPEEVTLNESQFSSEPEQESSEALEESAESSESAANPNAFTLEDVRRSCENQFGVLIYIGGFSDEDYSVEAIRSAVSENEFAEKYQFIESIPDECIVSVNGEEIWLFVPKTVDADVAVYPTDVDNDAEYDENDPVYEGKGEPIILLCNVSDIVDNSKITVTVNGEAKTFIPMLSGD